MAIQMTRAEYEAQYGTQPVLNSSALDTTPAPMRMTRAEYNAAYRPELTKPSETRSTLSKASSFLPAQFRIPDFKETAQDIEQTKQSFGDAKDKLLDRVSYIRGRVERGETTPLRGTVDTMAQGFTQGANALFELGIGAAKTQMPQSTENKVADVVGDTVQEATDYAGRKADQYRSDPRTQPLMAWLDEAAQLYKTDETFKNDVNTSLGILDLVFSFTGAPKAAKVGTDAIEKTVGTIDDLAKRADIPAPLRTAVNNATDARTQRLITQAEKDIFDIENAYAPTRKANTFSADEGSASRRRIAQAGVLADTVDSDGIIRTTRPGGAVEQYERMTVDGVEDVVRRNLEREGLTAPLQELSTTLKRSIAESNLEGADLVTALKGVQRELQGLALRGDNIGQVPLVKIHDAKISATKNINYLTPPEQQAYRKAIARGYKDFIERKSSFNVKEVNSELAKYYEDIDRLKRLDGRRVKGGRLGKYFAQLSGNVAGGVAGVAVGGPVGGALGTIIGGETSAFLQGRSMARTFRKGGTGVPENKVLNQAKATADMPNQRPLNKPDPVVGAPKNTPKTKDVAKVERQIRDNVKKQKAAIKAGDFTLVAALKEVYDALVDQLKRLVDDIKESVKNPGLGLSTRDVTKGTGKADYKARVAATQSVKELKELAQLESELVPLSKLIIDEDMKAAHADVLAGRNSMTDMPILAIKQKDGMYLVEDGRHRTVQAALDGGEDIWAITDKNLYDMIMEKEGSFYTNVSKHKRGDAPVTSYRRRKT